MSSVLSEKVETYLGEKNYGQLVEEIFNPDNLVHIHSEGMDLITKICENGLAFTTDDNSTTACAQSLLHIVKNYRPKESLICLLEQGEAFVNSEKFNYLLQPLQYVMLNLPKKREKTFSWVLSTLKSHIKYFHQIPEELRSNFDEPKDTLLLEQDPSVKSALISYRDYINFYTPFVEQLATNSQQAISANDTEAIESVRRQREYLRDYLVDLLGIPLIYFNLDWNPKQDSTSGEAESPKIKTDSRLVAEKLMHLLQITDPNPLHYLQWIENRMFISSEPKQTKKKSLDIDADTDAQSNEDSDDDEEDEVIVHMSSLVTYFYLIFNKCLQSRPTVTVFSPTYIFNTILYPVTTVIKNPSNILALKKAIELTSKLLSFCDISPSGCSSSSTPQVNYDHKLHHNLLKKEVHSLFIDRLAYLTIYCQSKSIRTEAYRLLRNYLMAFDAQGKYDFFHYIFHRVPNDSLVGHMITELKQFIFISMDSKHRLYEPGMENYFLGISGIRIITIVCKLKDGATTDLCQNSNSVISALNLLRFLLLREKVQKEDQGQIGIAEMFPKIEEVMLKPLRSGLDISRAHYELKLKELNNPYLRKERESEEKRMFENGKCDIQIGKEQLKPGDISTKDQKASLVEALNIFDHMNGLLAWVYEAQSSKS